MNISHAPRAMRANSGYSTSRFKGTRASRYSLGRNGGFRANTFNGSTGPFNRAEVSYPGTASVITEEKWHAAYVDTEIQIPVRKGRGYVMRTVPRSEAPDQHPEVMRLCYPEVYGKSSFEVLIQTTNLQKNGRRVPRKEELNAVYNDQAWPSTVALVYTPGSDFSPNGSVVADTVVSVLNPWAPVFSALVISVANSGDTDLVDIVAPNETFDDGRETPSRISAAPAMTCHYEALSEALFEPIEGRLDPSAPGADGSESSFSDAGFESREYYIGYATSVDNEDDESAISVCESETTGEIEKEACYICGALVNDHFNCANAAAVGAETCYRMVADGHSLRATRAADHRMVAAGKGFPVTVAVSAFGNSLSGSSSGEEAEDEEYNAQDLAGLSFNFEAMVKDLVTFAGEWDGLHMLTEEVQGYGNGD